MLLDTKAESPKDYWIDFQFMSNQYAISITRLGDESAASECYRRVHECDTIDPIVKAIDMALEPKKVRKRRSDAKQPSLPNT